MATVKPGYSHHESYIAILAGATYGTPNSDGSNYTKLDLVGSAVPSFQPEKFEDSTLRNQGYNVGDIGDLYSTPNGLLHRYTIPEFYANSDVLGFFLYGAVQGVSEAAGGVYVKTFTANGSQDPDFSASAGYFFDVLIGNPIGSDSQKLTSCIVESLTLRVDQETRRLVASATVVTGKGYTLTSNPSGTNNLSTVAIPNFHNSTARTLSINSLDLVWKAASLTITNSIATIGDDGSGTFDNLKLVKQIITGSFVVKYDTNSDAFLTGDQQHTDINATTLTLGASDTIGYFYFNCPDTILRTVGKDAGDDNQVQNLTLEVEFVADHSATQYPAFATADGVDRSW